MKTYAVFQSLQGKRGCVIGYAKQYANGQWVFSPSVNTGRKATGKRCLSFEACLPKWTGGLAATESELQFPLAA